jgi:hypothetical protein
MVLMVYSGARGTLIYEKNLKSKFSCQTPFKLYLAWTKGIASKPPASESTVNYVYHPKKIAYKEGLLTGK